MAVVVLVGAAVTGRALASPVCDPPGPPPRFGCQWSTDLCDWVCAVCDPFGSAPRTSCSWDPNRCNWICPGYSGVEVQVRTNHPPDRSATVYVKLSSLCAATGVIASCGGSFAAVPSMTSASKCHAIADIVAGQCQAAGYELETTDCDDEASFTARNAGCPSTPFVLGLSNDASTFDETADGPLPDGESETICAPPAGASQDLRVDKAPDGTDLHLSWTNGTNDDGYVVFEDAVPAGRFDAVAGTAASGTSGLTMPLPSETEYYLIAGSNATCGVGVKR